MIFLPFHSFENRSFGKESRHPAKLEGSSRMTPNSLLESQVLNLFEAILFRGGHLSKKLRDRSYVRCLNISTLIRMQSTSAIWQATVLGRRTLTVRNLFFF